MFVKLVRSRKKVLLKKKALSSGKGFFFFMLVLYVSSFKKFMYWKLDFKDAGSRWEENKLS